jgi:hypothetical protein
VKRPRWAESSAVRRWLALAAVVIVLLAGRVAIRSFGAQAVLSDGARAYASCKAPWRSARIALPAERFTLWVMTGGTGKLREEGVSTLGARCRRHGQRRMALATTLLAASAVIAWLALPRPKRPRPDPPPAPMER